MNDDQWSEAIESIKVIGWRCVCWLGLGGDCWIWRLAAVWSVGTCPFVEPLDVLAL